MQGDVADWNEGICNRSSHLINKQFGSFSQISPFRFFRYIGWLLLISWDRSSSYSLYLQTPSSTPSLCVASNRKLLSRGGLAVPPLAGAGRQLLSYWLISAGTGGASGKTGPLSWTPEAGSHGTSVFCTELRGSGGGVYWGGRRPRKDVFGIFHGTRRSVDH